VRPAENCGEWSARVFSSVSRRPYAVGRYLESQLFGLEALDPFTASLALLALIAIAGMASLLPARRAARVSPLTALREE
jgi:hypothetical protein